MLKGINASEGYGIGRAMIVKEQSLDYTPKKGCDPAKELKRYHDAVDSVIKKTQRLALRMKSAVGEKEAEILSGHITMIKDPYMTSEIEKQINDGVCAESALESICDMFIMVFSSAEDELTKQRATDVTDIKNGVLSILLGREERDISLAPPNTVLIVRELTPSMTAGIVKKNIVGIVTETGGRTSHSAIIARAMEIPAVLSVSGATHSIEDGARIIVDGNEGVVIPNPSTPEVDKFTKKNVAFIEERKMLSRFVGIPTKTADNEQKELLCNIGTPAEAARALEKDAEGIGLFRTEFLFMDRGFAPSEEEQFESYKKAALIMKNKPVIIRTLDVGGDKNISYLKMPKEENPFLGFRAVRYCLKNRDLYRAQLRALLRASVYGDIRIMVPLVSSLEELIGVKKLIEELKRELKRDGVPFDKNIKVGVMIETPAAAAIADLLAKEADFFSMGTNDLTQYMIAVDRGNPDVAYLYSTFHPAVLRAIKYVIKCAKDERIPVGMCGEAAADRKLVPVWISFGLDEFSVNPASVLTTRKEIACWTKKAADEITNLAMSKNTAEEVEEALSVKRQ